MLTQARIPALCMGSDAWHACMRFDLAEVFV